MSSELERRLEGLLGELPEPKPEVGERALAVALPAIRPAASGHRGFRTAVLVFASACVLLAIAAGSLAAVGALHVRFGAAKRKLTQVKTLQLPSGTAGVAAVVDGRLSVVTKSGFRLQGLPVSAASLSPHALFVAAGIGHSLVAMAPDGRRAWSQPEGGPVVAIAWAPFGNRIAYIVHAGKRFVLHVIWGDGTHDGVLDRRVRAVRPSWRADSLAFAYVGAGGHAIVYDVAHQRRSVLPVDAPVTGVAFAPAGDAIAVEQSSGIWLLDQSAAGKIQGHVASFGWLRGRFADVVQGQGFSLVRLYAADGASRGSSRVRGSVAAVAPKLVVVLRNRQLVAGDTDILTLPRGAKVQSLEIR